jgi:iron complex transport system ATP-binding protein
MLRQGRVLACGPLAETLTTESLSACFDMEVVLERRHDRWFAFAHSPPDSGSFPGP